MKNLKTMQERTSIKNYSMPRLNVKSTYLAFAMLSLLTISCADNKKDSEAPITSSEAQENTSTSINEQNPIISDYMELKDALVETDESAASGASTELKNALENFDYDHYSDSEKMELDPIIASAIKHATAITNSDIDGQRVSFEQLSNDVLKIVQITGTETTLYQQYCPMYGDDGAAWLSTEEQIQNPYFGSKMMTCGEVQKEIN